MILFIISISLLQIAGIMTLRIKELCKEKHITMKELAEKMGITPITLSQSLNGNPTLSRLQEVASILDVSVPELFASPKSISKEIHGCIYVDGKERLIKSKDDLSKLLDEL